MMASLPRQHRLVLAAAMIVATVPLWFAAIPPLNDLPGHMGRYHLQLELDSNPFLQRHWDLHWMLIGNLGVDLIMQVLGRLIGVERGAWLVAILIPPLMIWGIVRLANAYQGYVPPTVVAAFPLVFSYPYQTGLVNFWLAMALAFHASASVIGSPERWTRPLLLGASSVLLWICHIYGWAIFVGIVATDRFIARRNVPLMQRFTGLLALATPVLLMIYQSYGQHSTARTLGWFRWDHKFRSLIHVMRDQYALLDFLTFGMCILPFLAALLFRKQLRIARRPILAAAGLTAAALVLPYQLFGSAWADARLWPIILILVALSVVPKPGAGALWTVTVPALILALFAARAVVDAAAFRAYNVDYERQLAALQVVPRGSRLAYFVAAPCGGWRRDRLEHLDGIAILRKDLFTNGQWEVPGAETVTPLAARGTWANSDPSQLVRINCWPERGHKLHRMVELLPRDRFDYLWIMGFKPDQLPLYPGLRRVYVTDKAVLYRIQRP